MRNMRRISEKFEFSLDGRQISLLFFLIVLLIGLSFSIGVMYGRGLKKIEKPDLAVQEEKPLEILAESEQAKVQQPGSAQPGTDLPAKTDTYTFYESLSKETPPPGIEPGVEEQKEVLLPPSSEGAEQSKETVPPVETKREEQKEKKESEKTITTATKGEYSVQVVAYNDRERARSMVKRLKSKGFNAFIEEGKSGGKRIFRVKIGYFNTKEDAERVTKELKKMGLNGFITR